MDRQYPIYTVDTECQDCYKCVRHCPVKAIKIEQARAAVVPEFCVACGRCVDICPADAKRVRDDVEGVRTLLLSGRTVYLSLAPSYAGEFSRQEAEALPGICAALGFAGVSETALGADAVSAGYRQLLMKSDDRLMISTACPVAVEFIQKYLPEFAECLAELPSPMMVHGRLLREWYGEDIAVVFAGPCIAKKRESDRFGHMIDAALTFKELRELLGANKGGVDRAHAFVPRRAGHGALYPVNGGMIDVIRDELHTDVEMVTVSGLEQIRTALQGMRHNEVDGRVFLEVLACEGGCIHGPGMTNRGAGLLREVAVRSECRDRVNDSALNWHKTVNDEKFVLRESAVCRPAVEDDRLRSALMRVGKMCRDDELNCGGCGYETCRGFAAALLDGRAEPAMCLSYLRNQAQKKANALLRSMPSGVVIVDADLYVVECNEKFAGIFGEDTLQSFRVRPGLEGAHIDRILPFADVFYTVLRTGDEFHRDLMQVGERLLNVMVFSIEAGQTVGGIFQDVTDAEVRREHIAARAREVIDKNLVTVQDIACRLGEHMADTELLLRSIASDYGKKDKV